MLLLCEKALGQLVPRQLFSCFQPLVLCKLGPILLETFGPFIMENIQLIKHKSVYLCNGRMVERDL